MRRPPGIGLSLCALLAASPWLAVDGAPGDPVLGHGWTVAGVSGQALPRGDRFRTGLRRTLEGADLVAFVELRATSPVRLEILPE